MSNKSNSSNLKKYQTSNPVILFLLKRFFGKISRILNQEKFSKALDVGCGEGFGIRQLQAKLPEKVFGGDLNQESVIFAKTNCPEANFMVFDIHKLPFLDDDFDLTICCEVLEHLEDPATALKELLRVSRGTLVISVPHEPWFSIGSFLRLKYLKTWGRHPEHIQAWSGSSLREFLQKNLSEDFQIFYSFPWTIVKIECRIPADKAS